MKTRFTAHDVRKLRLCGACNGLGHLDRMLSVRWLMPEWI